MMMFNVEDLLALPQLKVGKLPKNISEINLKAALDQVWDIMDYKLTAKEIETGSLYLGFDSVEDYSV